MENAKVLVVDDEAAIREMVRISLELSGLTCIEASDAQDAHAKVIDERPNLILLDWMMPGLSGIDFARRLKRDESTAEIPILMLTAKGEESNKVQALDTGADDYITKPFSTRELASRIKAVLRRCYPTLASKEVRVDQLCLNSLSHSVSVAGEPIHMGPTEYKLLEFFMTHQERAYSRSQLLDQVWGGNVYVEDRTVDVHIRRLRKVLSPYGYDMFVQTVRGTGYRFSKQNLSPTKSVKSTSSETLEC